ncbi:hypothetical protein E6H35_06805 [Candidatus Bathyarchaeota archaeon]|nr:MAG: hypothetical protein E6H35_06805 [Candidatus Bathyarchaeota archaeon]
MPQDFNATGRTAHSKWRFILFITVFLTMIIFMLARGATVLAGLTFTIFSATILVVMFRSLFQAQE